jgi:hypothetical protein
MALDFVYSDAVNSARLNAIEPAVTGAPILRIYSGAMPAINVAATGGAAMLCAITLPDPWLSAASGTFPNVLVSKTAWAAGTAGNTGAASYFRIQAAASAETAVGQLQGTCGIGATFDMNFDNNNINSGQTVTINTFSIKAGNQEV